MNRIVWPDSVASVALLVACRICAGWLAIVFALADEIGGIVFAAHCRFG